VVYSLLPRDSETVNRLNAVAVGQLAVVAARIVRVEEIVIVILVVLPDTGLGCACERRSADSHTYPPRSAASHTRPPTSRQTQPSRLSFGYAGKGPSPAARKRQLRFTYNGQTCLPLVEEEE
jgi:hypothetical protein